MKLKRQHTIAIFWLIGVVIILWSIYAEKVYGPEAAVGSAWLIVLMGFPFSLPVGYLIAEIFNKFWPNEGYTVIPMVLILFSGFFQWFFLLPKLIEHIKKLRSVKAK